MSDIKTLQEVRSDPPARHLLINQRLTMSDTNKFLILPVQTLTSSTDKLRDYGIHSLRQSCHSFQDFISSDRLCLQTPREIEERDGETINLVLEFILSKKWPAEKIVWVGDITL